MIKNYQDISLTKISYETIPLKISKTLPEEITFKVKLNWDLNIFIRNRFSNILKNSKLNFRLTTERDVTKYINFQLINTKKFYIYKKKETSLLFSYFFLNYFIKIVEQFSTMDKKIIFLFIKVSSLHTLQSYFIKCLITYIYLNSEISGLNNFALKKQDNITKKVYQNNEIKENKTFSNSILSSIKDNLVSETSFLMIIRLKGKFDIQPKVKSIFKSLGLRKINTAIVIKNNSKIKSLLSKINPYIVWGELKFHAFIKLVLQRGVFKFKNTKVHLNKKSLIQILNHSNKNSNLNQMSEFLGNNLTSYNEYLLERLNKLIEPFTLSSPRMHINRKYCKYTKKTMGYVGSKINTILLSML